MLRLLAQIRNFFSSTGTAFHRTCDEIVVPMMSKMGFRLVEFDRDGSFANATFRNGDRWIRIWIGQHPADYPGDAGISLGVGPSNWPDRARFEVPLEAYILAKTSDSPSFSKTGSVVSIIDAMRMDIEKFASDFMSGDLNTYQSALAKHRF